MQTKAIAKLVSTLNERPLLNKTQKLILSAHQSKRSEDTGARVVN